MQARVIGTTRASWALRLTTCAVAICIIISAIPAQAPALAPQSGFQKKEGQALVRDQNDEKDRAMQAVLDRRDAAIRLYEPRARNLPVTKVEDIPFEEFTITPLQDITAENLLSDFYIPLSIVILAQQHHVNALDLLHYILRLKAPGLAIQDQMLLYHMILGFDTLRKFGLHYEQNIHSITDFIVMIQEFERGETFAEIKRMEGQLSNRHSEEFKAFIALFAQTDTLTPITDLRRYPEHLMFLEEHLLPRLVEQKKAEGNRAIHITSLGTSRGLDLLEIAAILQKILGPELDQWKIVLEGQDINPASLEVFKTQANLPPSFTIAPRITILGDSQDQQRIADTPYDILLLRTAAEYLHPIARVQLAQRFNAKYLLVDEWVHPDPTRYNNILPGLFQNIAALPPFTFSNSDKQQMLEHYKIKEIVRTTSRILPRLTTGVTQDDLYSMTQLLWDKAQQRKNTSYPFSLLMTPQVIWAYLALTERFKDSGLLAFEDFATLAVDFPAGDSMDFARAVNAFVVQHPQQMDGNTFSERLRSAMMAMRLDPFPHRNRGQIGNRATLIDIEGNQAKVRDSQGAEHILHMASRPWDNATLQSRLQQKTDVVAPLRGFISWTLDLADHAGVKFYYYDALCEDLLGFASPRHNAIGLHQRLQDNWIALFHEAAEFLLRKGDLSLTLHNDEIIALSSARGEFHITLNEETSRIAQIDPNNPHYLLRALQRQIFGPEDEQLTMDIETFLRQDDFVTNTAKESEPFDLIAKTIIKVERASPKTPAAPDRLQKITDEIQAQLKGKPHSLMWNHVFTWENSDYFDYTIGAKRYLLHYTDGRLQQAQSEVLATALDKFYAQQRSRYMKPIAQLAKELPEVIQSLKIKRASNESIKDPIAQRIPERLPIAPEYPLKWNILERSGKQDHFLFSIFHRHYYIAYDPASRSVTKDFADLQILVEQLRGMIKNVLSPTEEPPTSGKTWEDLLGSIRHLQEAYGDALTQHGRKDVADFIGHVLALDPDNGYLDEIRLLSKKIQESAGDVPPVFRDPPLREKEYLVMQTVLVPRKEGKTGEVLEISAIRYKGNTMVGKFRSFVRPSRKSAKDIAQLAQHVGVEPDALQHAPTLDEVLDELRPFAAELPIVTHGGMDQLRALNKILEKHGKTPITNPGIDTVHLAKKLLPRTEEYPYKDHALHTLLRHFHSPLPPGTRGFRLLRVFHSLVQDLAMKAKQAVEPGKEKSWLYDRFVEQISPDPKPMQRKEFEGLIAQHPGRFHRANNWQMLRGLLLGGTVKVVFFDLDETTWDNKGPYGSDRMYRQEVVFKEQYKAFGSTLGEINRYCLRAHRLMLMEPEIPAIIREAQARGVRFVVLTARGRRSQDDEAANAAKAKPEPDQDYYIFQMLKTLDIHIVPHDILLAGKPDGKGADKPSAIKAFFQANSLPLSTDYAYMDDGYKYMGEMASHPDLSGGINIWYDTDVRIESRFFRYKDFLRMAKAKLDEKDKQSQIDALGYFLDAFWLAYRQETLKEVIEVGEVILRALPKYKAEKQFSTFLRGRITAMINEDPQLKRALIFHQLVKMPLGKTIHFHRFFKEMQKLWGNIQLNQRRLKDDIVNDKQLRLIRDVRSVSGMQGIQLFSRNGAKSTASISAITGGSDQRELRGGLLAIERYIKERLHRALPESSVPWEWLESLSALDKRDLFDALINQPDATPEQFLDIVSGFIGTALLEEQGIDIHPARSYTLELAA